MYKAILLEENHPDWVFGEVYSPVERAEIAKICEFPDRKFKIKELDPAYTHQVDFIFSSWGMPALTGEQIEYYFPNLKAVFYAAGSVQYFARPFLERGIKVFSAWVANGIPVAEFTVAQIILANKGYFARLVGSKSRINPPGKIFPGNYGAKVGIIGVGTIGRTVIEMLRPYHLQVLAYDAFLPEEKRKELGCEFVCLERIFSECDVISNHLADNPQTRGMLNKALFDRMKPLATFINTGRGRQVVEEDLAAALREHPGRTALLDVVTEEPIRPDNIFYNMDNVFLSPHIAGSIGGEIHRLAAFMADECKRLISGQPTLYEVTLPMLETMA